MWDRSSERTPHSQCGGRWVEFPSGPPKIIKWQVIVLNLPSQLSLQSVEERPQRVEAAAARRGGFLGSANVGISSKNPDENSGHRKSEVSWATRIDPGLVGPKARPKGVVDG